MVVFLAALAISPVQVDIKALESILGRKGTDREGVYRVSFPRRDLDVRVGDIRLEPAFALTTWAAFSPMGHGSSSAMLMGDFVVTAEEMPAAQKALLEGGLHVTGVHNHLIGQMPQIMYMHYSGKGDAATMARALVRALQSTKTPLGELSPLAADTPPPDWSEVERILGRTGTKNGSVLNLSIPRKETILHEGEPLKATNGGNSSLNFQFLGEGRAAVTSDLVLLSNEVNAVVAALQRGSILVTALHNHMLYDEPRTFHLHTWAVGEPKALATAIRAALDRMNNQ